jgi:hypothetical protein
MPLSPKTLKRIETILWVSTCFLVVGGIGTYVAMAIQLWREGRIIWSIVAFLPIAITVLLVIGLIISFILFERSFKRREDLRERRRISRLSSVLDNRVGFTAYKPGSVMPELWYPMLVFAFKADEPSAPSERVTVPSEEVRRQADAYFGGEAKSFPSATEESDVPLPRGANIRLIPEIEGFEFNPPFRLFLWKEDLHREEFRFRALSRSDGHSCEGSLRIYLNSLLIAELPLRIKVNREEARMPSDCRATPEYARRYRKIFVSYSHKDVEVVGRITELARAMGDRFLRDVTDLRAGQDWNSELLKMIDEADIFQLFWSTNSMYSSYVRKEWEHALALCRENFIRPVYWEDPLPRDPSQNLPPPELLRLHFHKLAIGIVGAGVPTALAMMAGPTRIEGKARKVCLGLLIASSGGFALFATLLIKSFGQGTTGGSYWFLSCFLFLAAGAIVAGCAAALIDYDEDKIS